MAKTSLKPNLAWQLYFCLFAALTFLFVIGSLVDRTLNRFDYIDIVVSLPLAVSTFSWAWKKRTLSQPVWITYTVLFLSFDIFYNFFLASEKARFDITTLIGFCLVAPAYFATILYSINWKRL
jgi:hypothetical protein